MFPDYVPTFPLFALLHRDTGLPLSSHLGADNFLLLFTDADAAIGYPAGKGWGDFRLRTIPTARDAADFLRDPPGPPLEAPFTAVSIDTHRDSPAAPLLFGRTTFLDLLDRLG